MFKRARELISEMIGRTRLVFRQIWQTSYYRTRDYTKTDYAFWDKAARGKAEGLELSGLLIKPVINKVAAWVMGRPLAFKSDLAGERVSAWWSDNLDDILRAYRDSLRYGDGYLVVNADQSVTVIPPHVIDEMVDENDFSQVIGYKIVETWPHPTEPGRKQIIEDRYTATERTRIIRNESGAPLVTTKYRNLLGRVPVIHIGNEVGSNERYGNPQLQAAVELLHKYGEVMDAGVNGNIRQGRPTPTVSFKDLKSLDKFFDIYAKKETVTKPDGTTETYESVPFSSDDVMAIVGDFKYAQPGSFAGDTQILLVLLYLLFLEHAEVPEFVMGSAVASSKASVSEQMPIWARFVDGKRTEAGGWIMELLLVVMGLMELVNDIPAVDEDITVMFEDLTTDDGKLTLDYVKWAYSEGLLDDVTALNLIPLEIEDPRGVIDAAKAEREKRREESFGPDYGQDINDTIRRLESDNVDNEDGDQNQKQAA